MSSKVKINVLVLSLVVLIMAAVFILVKAAVWSKYPMPITEKNVVISIQQAYDYPVDGKITYYYEVKADIRRSRGNWPFMKEEVLKSDTLLLLHNCSGA